MIQGNMKIRYLMSEKGPKANKYIGRWVYMPYTKEEIEQYKEVWKLIGWSRLGRHAYAALPFMPFNEWDGESLSPNLKPWKIEPVPHIINDLWIANLKEKWNDTKTT